MKPNRSPDARRGGNIQPGRLSQTNVTLRQLMQMAYAAQIVGGPNWIGVDRFDVEAKGDFDLRGFLPGPDGSPARVYVMLRALLRDRFRLRVHSESRTLPIFALQLARRDRRFGPQFRRLAVDCAALQAEVAKSNQLPPPPERGTAPPCGGAARPGQIVANGWSMARLAGALSQFVHRPVVDRTGLAGDFALDLQWTPEVSPSSGAARADAPSPPVDLPSIYTAVQEQLGLTLESTSGPLEVIVIDSVQPPAPN